MNKGTFSYIGLVLIFSAILAFSPSVLTLALCAVMAVVLTLFFSPASLIITGVTSFAVMLLWWGDAAFAATAVLSYLSTGFFVAFAIRGGKSFAAALTSGACAYLVCNTAGTYFSARSAGYTIMEALADVPLTEVKEIFNQMMTQANLPQEMTVQLDNMLNDLTSFVQSMLPASMITEALGFSLLVILLARFWLLRAGVIVSIERFSSLRADMPMTAACALLCLGAFFADGQAGVILLNVAAVIAVIYAALGAAAFLNLMRPKIPKAWKRGLILAALFFILNTVSVFCAGFFSTDSLATGVLLMFLPVLFFAAVGVISSLIPRKVEEK